MPKMYGKTDVYISNKTLDGVLLTFDGEIFGPNFEKKLSIY